jgi:hypothetical protein
MPFLPDSSDPSPWWLPRTYCWIAGVPRKACAWEFLRRNPDYRAAWAASRSAYRLEERIPGVTVINAVRTEVSARPWGLLGPFENPDFDARQANVLWTAHVHPAVLPVVAVANGAHGEQDLLPLTSSRCRTTVYLDPDGGQHVLFAQGGRFLQLEVKSGSVFSAGRLLPDVLASAAPVAVRTQTVRQLADLAASRDLRAPLYRPHTQGRRLIQVLQALDGERAGASRRDIAIALFGEERVRRGWRGANMRNRVRNAVRRGVALMNGGYMQFLK